jgi:hypothetical protein
MIRCIDAADVTFLHTFGLFPKQNEVVKLFVRQQVPWPSANDIQPGVIFKPKCSGHTAVRVMRRLSFECVCVHALL